MDLSVIDKPEVQFFILKSLGTLITGLIGMVLFFVKRLIREVKEAIRSVTILTLKFDNFEKQFEDSVDAQRDLSEKLHAVQSDVKVLEHSVLRKKRDNGSRTEL